MSATLRPADVGTIRGQNMGGMRDRLARSIVVLIAAAVGFAPMGAAGARPHTLIAALPSSPGMFVATAPTRLLDTRTGSGGTRLAAHSTLTLQVAGVGPVPVVGAGAVVLSLTATAPTTSGYLVAYPGGGSRPLASSLNFAGHQSVANLVTVPVGGDGAIDFYNGSAGSVDVVADIEGFYVAGTPYDGGAFVATTPTRLLDTRVGLGAGAQHGGGTIDLQLAGLAPVPIVGVSAVVLNVTVTRPTSSGFLSVYPGGSARPGTSALEFARGQTVADQVTVALGSAGDVQLYNGSPGTTQVVADVAGYYLSGVIRNPGAFVATPPTRLLDTRTSVGGLRPAARGTTTFRVAGRGLVPESGVYGVVLTVSATAPVTDGYLTVYPGGSTRPGTSVLDFAAGQTVAAQALEPLGPDGTMTVYNGSAGATDVVADVSGYFLAGPTTEVAPNTPIALSLAPSPHYGSRVGCGSPLEALSEVGANLTVGAWISDANGPVDLLYGHFRLRDYGANVNDEPVDLVDFGSPRGLTIPVAGSGGYVSARFDSKLLVDGHEYAVDAVADDGTTTSAISQPCYFRYDTTAPVASMTADTTTFQVGRPFTLTLNGIDPAPSGGAASGVADLEFTLSATAAAKGVGTAYQPGDKVTITPTGPGVGYAYLTAVDYAENTSAVFTFEYDATS